MRTITKLSLAALAMGAVGCGGGPGSKALGEMDDASLASELDVASFAAAGSAPKIYMFTAGMQLQAQVRGGACPVVKVDGNTTTYEGGCTDDEGQRWVGRLVDKRDAAGASVGTVSFEAFGTESVEDCGDGGTTFTQRMVIDGTAKTGGTNSKTTFDVDVAVTGTEVTESCTAISRRIAYDYSGEVEGTLPNMATQNTGTPTTWNGRGRLGVDGIGVANVETVDEVIDFDECQTEALSGKTVITAGKDEAVISYDGASECSLDSSATWTLNGTAKGTISGVGCSALGGSAMSAWGLIALGGMLLRRRRNG